MLQNNSIEIFILSWSYSPLPFSSAVSTEDLKGHRANHGTKTACTKPHGSWGWWLKITLRASALARITPGLLSVHAEERAVHNSQAWCHAKNLCLQGFLFVMKNVTRLFHSCNYFIQESPYLQ